MSSAPIGRRSRGWGWTLSCETSLSSLLAGILFAGSVLNCHAVSGARGAAPVSLAPAPIAEAPLVDDSTMGAGFARALLPVTIQGHTLPFALDLGTSINELSETATAQFHLVVTEAVAPGDKGPHPQLDSLTIGTAVQRHVHVAQTNASDYAEFGLARGLLGTPALSRYDLVFDGPARRVRLYAQPATHTAATPAPGWLPPGITRADCIPMRGDPDGAHRVFFDLQADGHSIRGMFDSGYGWTYTNLAGARLLGLTQSNPRVHPLASEVYAGRFTATWDATDMMLTVGAQHFPAPPILVFDALPRSGRPDDPVLVLGLDAIRDRILVVSYSTGEVCLGGSSAPRPTSEP